MSWNISTDDKGAYKRKESQFRKTITHDCSSEYPAEAGRYHLYVSYACPWAHRTLIVRALKGLEDTISVSVVHSFLEAGVGWKFDDSESGATPDHVNGFKTLREVYLQSDPGYSSNVTVPVLYDKKTKTIVNNESAEIIVMLNTAFNAFCKTDTQRTLDLYPAGTRGEVDAVNSWVYDNINNGVYKCGFATTQGAYTEAFNHLFEHLDKAEAILAKTRYLTGPKMTLADIRLFTTLVRFDAVYYVHFKTNLRLLESYPNLSGFVRDLYQTERISETVRLDHIKNHYYISHTHINPFGIVPLGPILDFTRPHTRADTGL